MTDKGKSSLTLLYKRRELKSIFPLWKREIQGDLVVIHNNEWVPPSDRPADPIPLRMCRMADDFYTVIASGLSPEALAKGEAR